MYNSGKTVRNRWTNTQSSPEEKTRITPLCAKTKWEREVREKFHVVVTKWEEDLRKLPHLRSNNKLVSRRCHVDRFIVGAKNVLRTRGRGGIGVIVWLCVIAAATASASSAHEPACRTD